MDNNNKETKTYKIGDELIAVIRELLQLSILTGTNIVDHLRAVVVEVDEITEKLVPTEEYVQSYNVMVTQLIKKAEEVTGKQQQQENDDSEEEEEEGEDMKVLGNVADNLKDLVIDDNDDGEEEETEEDNDNK